MKKVAKYHEISKIENTKIMEKIHINFRLSYLKDNALGFYLDEGNILQITMVLH